MRLDKEKPLNPLSLRPEVTRYFIGYIVPLR